MSPRTTRVERNQDLFRLVNEQIAELVDRWNGDDIHVVCECANTGCGTMVGLAFEEYGRIRANPGWFVIAPQHAVSEDEYVVENHVTYQIVKAPEHVESGGDLNVKG